MLERSPVARPDLIHILVRISVACSLHFSGRSPNPGSPTSVFPRRVLALITSMSSCESWPLTLNCRALAIGADPVGPFMRSQIGSYVLAMVASYAPASLSPVLTPAEKAHVTQAVRGSVLNHVRHWLRPYVDRPQLDRCQLACVTVSRRAFHDLSLIHISEPTRPY